MSAPSTTFDIARAADDLKPKLDYDATVFDACLILESRIRQFEIERAGAKVVTLFDHSEGEIKLLNALEWLFVQIPDESWIVKL